MHRLFILLPLVLCAMGLEGQTSSSITISANPTGPQFAVDGIVYTQPVTFSWPEGSEHYLVFLTDPPLPGATTSTVQTAINGETQWAFEGWKDNQGLVQPASATVQTITANPAITTFTAEVGVSYRVNLSFYSSGGTPSTTATCGAPGAIPSGQSSPGVVYFGSSCYWSSSVLFAAAGATEILNAYPYPGFAFTGWEINGATPTSFLTSITINAPTNIYAMFVPAKRVSFLTSPLGLQVLIDHTPAPTRTQADVPNCPNNETIPVPVQLGFPPLCFGDFDFAPGSSHYISGVTPQRDASGNWWVFSDWSNGLPQDSILQVDNNPNQPLTLTAEYVAGAQVEFITSPTGLQLSIDGQTNWPSYDFVWGVGTSHQVSAPATETGTNGRVYTFQGWSNQTAPSQTVTVTPGMAAAGFRLTANYSMLSRVVVQSSPTGLTVQVDGTSCVTPCNVDRQNGATVHLTAPTQVSLGQGARLDFGSWSDGGASDHTITVTQEYATVTASYGTSYQLTASSNPSNGSTFNFTPSSSDLFFAQGTSVYVTAVPKPGFKFGHWTGALSGSGESGSVVMNAPETVVAQLATVPYIAPAGISNGVGQTPSTAVAPGSIISIFGQSLATVVQTGSTNPLPQTIAGTSVTVNSTILPLLFVSPTQINAQLPSDLSDGNYTLEVQNAGQPNISGSFTVARDAPGLFFWTSGSTEYATAFHADGSLVTTSSPATGGETISLLGTGFGPYQTSVLDGFYPQSPPPAVADSVTLSLAGAKVAATSTAAPNYIGIVSMQFQVPTGLSSSTPVTIQVSINGIDSNTVMLPIQ